MGGTVVIRRMKTHTAASGYVYQYYFVGKRPALADDAEAGATEFIFDVSADRKTIYAVSVFLREDALETWAASHGRRLSDSEQYAAAKMCLMRGFDEVEDVFRNGRRLVVDGTNIVSLLEPLGVE